MESTPRPWLEIEQLIELGDARALEGYLEQLSAGDTARAFANLDADAQHQVLLLLGPGDAAAALEELPGPQAAGMIEELETPQAAAILGELASDERADLLGELSDESAGAILDQMPPEQASAALELARYPRDCAGGLMVTECLSYPQDVTCRDVLADLQARGEDLAGYEVQYIYVTDRNGALLGVLPLRSLVLASPDRRVTALLIRDLSSVRPESDLDELREFFDAHPFYGAPVVDADGSLKGVVRRSDTQRALEERAGRDHLKFQGIVGGEELRTMGVGRRASRRLSWLSINIVLNLIAASVIAAYQDTLSAVIALAVFLPIISDMSGCSGNQAVAVSLRELTAGLVQPVDALRVWLKEISVGLINGAVLGSLVAAAAWLWKGSPWLGAVVGGALALNTLVAVSIGGVIPLALKRLEVDPALASGPILTTVTDMCGFFFLLGMATLALPRLVGI